MKEYFEQGASKQVPIENVNAPIPLTFWGRGVGGTPISFPQWNMEPYMKFQGSPPPPIPFSGWEYAPSERVTRV